MERNFTNENFERFLRQNADGLRMRPSDKVWRGIDQHFKKKRRRTTFLLAFSLLLTSSIGYYLVEGSLNPPVPTADRSAAPVKNPAATLNPTTNFSDQSDAKPTSTEVSSSGAPTGSLVSRTPLTSFFNRALLLTNESFSQLSLALNNTTTQGQSSVLTDAEFQPTIVDDYPGTASSEEKQQVSLSHRATDPLSIESVVNGYQPRLRRNKVGLQFFFTPTVSYRRLSENKAFTRTSGNSFQQGVYNINNAVTHKPDFGFQVGLLAKYPISNKIKLRGGLQFNVNRYDIKTFNSSYQVATIQFRDDQTLNAVTSYNNFSGYKSDWLENFYFQVAVPIGMEMKVSGNEKTQLGVAATIQPTYLLGDKAYLISKDYKNYMEVPWLVRNWNMNAGFETFVSYSTGKVRWQVGPQVRYQLLSTYAKKYPVKEHLFDFGLKVGVSLNKQ